MPPRPGLDDARLLLTAAESLIAKALARAREITAHGDEIDAHQVLAERVAYAATEGRAARAFVDFATDAGRDGRGSERLETLCAASVAQLVRSLRERIDGVLLELGLDESALEDAFPARVRDCLRRTGSEAVLREIGRQVPPCAVAIACRSTSSRSRCARRCASSRIARWRRRRSGSIAATRWSRSPSSRRWPSSATSVWRCPRPTAARSSATSP